MVARFAAMSLSVMRETKQFGEKSFSGEQSRDRMESWIAQRLWELAQDESDLWQPTYIAALGQCVLPWEQLGQEWYDAVRAAKTESSLQAWERVIEQGGYSHAADRESLEKLLVQILESGEALPKGIRVAAMSRLGEIARVKESGGFNEPSLSLPLSRRVHSS